METGIALDSFVLEAIASRLEANASSISPCNSRKPDMRASGIRSVSWYTRELWGIKSRRAGLWISLDSNFGAYAL